MYFLRFILSILITGLLTSCSVQDQIAHHDVYVHRISEQSADATFLVYPDTPETFDTTAVDQAFDNTYIGTAFAVRSDGYILTANHVGNSRECVTEFTIYFRKPGDIYCTFISRIGGGLSR